MRQVNVRFPELQAEALRLYALKFNKSQADIIRDGVERKILGKMQCGDTGIVAYTKLIEELKHA
jgi:hypothetical protein